MPWSRSGFNAPHVTCSLIRLLLLDNLSGRGNAVLCVASRGIVSGRSLASVRRPSSNSFSRLPAGSFCRVNGSDKSFLHGARAPSGLGVVQMMSALYIRKMSMRLTTLVA
jgi:hypothetical protein